MDKRILTYWNTCFQKDWSGKLVGNHSENEKKGGESYDDAVMALKNENVPGGGHHIGEEREVVEGVEVENKPRKGSFVCATGHRRMPVDN